MEKKKDDLKKWTFTMKVIVDVWLTLFIVLVIGGLGILLFYRPVVGAVLLCLLVIMGIGIFVHLIIIS